VLSVRWLRAARLRLGWRVRGLAGARPTGRWLAGSTRPRSPRPGPLLSAGRSRPGPGAPRPPTRPRGSPAPGTCATGYAACSAPHPRSARTALTLGLAGAILAADLAAAACQVLRASPAWASLLPCLAGFGYLGWRPAWARTPGPGPRPAQPAGRDSVADSLWHPGRAGRRAGSGGLPGFGASRTALPRLRNPAWHG
jgi:hypothetical protein